MNVKDLSLFTIFTITLRLCQSKIYTNYSLYVTTPTEISHLKFLRNLQIKNYFDVIFWKHSYRIHDSVQIMVHEKDEFNFLERLRHYNLTAEMSLTNVQDAFDRQKIAKYTPLLPDTFSWDAYPKPADISLWLKDLAFNNPEIQLHVIGKSAEDRELTVVEVNTSKNNSKPVVIVEGGIHGNEWISIAFVTYLIESLTYAGVYKNNEMRDLVHQYCWYLIPVANPDGFEYSFTEDRLWRKNRRKLKWNGDTFGVDLNRNFDFSFGKKTIDTTDESSDYYCGTNAFSEPESKAIANFIESTAADLKFYFAIHAFGEKIIIPYSDTVQHIENYEQAANLAAQASAAMYEMYGTKYGVGTNFDVFGGKISGNSACWVKQKFQIRYVYTFVLRDNGTYGYALPAEQIKPTCKEALTGLIKIMTSKLRPAVRNSQGVYVLVNETPNIFLINQHLMCYLIITCVFSYLLLL